MKRIISVLLIFFLSVSAYGQNDSFTKTNFFKKQATAPTNHPNNTWIGLWFNNSGVPNYVNSVGANVPIQGEISVSAPITKVSDLISIPRGTALVDGYIHKDDFASFAGRLIAASNLSDLTNTTTARTNLGVAIGVDVQQFDTDLSALAGLGTTGIVIRTGAGTAATRSLAAGSSKLSVANADGTGGNPTFDVNQGNLSIADSQLTFTDITTGNSSASAHGFLPKLSNIATDVFRGDGTFGATPLPQSLGTTDSPTFANIMISNGGAVRTGTSDANSLLFRAYDVDGAAYTTFGTLTAGNTPTFDLSDSVTKNGQYIYRAGGTNVAIADGGTNADNATDARTNLGLGDSATRNVGTAAGDVATGDRGVTNGDTHDHIGGDGNPITESAFSFSDVTTANATASAHGLLPKLSGNAAQFLDGTGAFSSPSGGVGGSGTVGQLPYFSASTTLANTDLYYGTNRFGINRSSKLNTFAVQVKANFSATGTVAISNAVATITGTGTTFLSQLGLGDTVTIGGVNRIITAIASDTSATVSPVWGATLSGQTMTIKPGAIRVDNSSGTIVSNWTNDGRLAIATQGMLDQHRLVINPNDTLNSNAVIQVASTANTDIPILIQRTPGNDGLTTALQIENNTGTAQFKLTGSGGFDYLSSGVCQFLFSGAQYFSLSSGVAGWADSAAMTSHKGGSAVNRNMWMSSGNANLTRNAFLTDSFQVSDQGSTTAIPNPVNSGVLASIHQQNWSTGLAAGRTMFRLYPGTLTTQNASVEIKDTYFDSARTITWSTGALTNQRSHYFTAPTLAFAGASTVTNAATVAISGAPVAGTNATLTNTHALLVEAGNTALNGGFTVGSGNTAISNIYTATSSLDFPSTAIQSYSDLTITVTGAADGDTVSLGVPNGSMVNNCVYFAWVSASNTVTVRLLNNDTVSAADPASGTFKVRVLK